jgi:hypothetical protein
MSQKLKRRAQMSQKLKRRAQMPADDRAEERWWSFSWRLLCTVYVCWLIVTVAILVAVIKQCSSIIIN